MVIPMTPMVIPMVDSFSIEFVSLANCKLLQDHNLCCSISVAMILEVSI